jgi:hypothetical protein
MNRLTVALLAALDAALAVSIGIGFALVPLAALWAFQFEMSFDWSLLWRGAVDVWLLGNGASMRVTLDTALVTAIGFPGAAASFLVSLAPLAFTLATVLFGIRTGMRAARSSWWQGAVVIAVVVFGVLAFAASLSAVNVGVRPSIVQGTLIPTLRFGLGVLGAALWVRFRNQTGPDLVIDGLRSLTDRIQDDVRAVIGTALRGGAIVVFGIISVAAIVLAVMIAVHYGTIISLHESAQLGAFGGTIVTLAELLFLPNLVIWTASWLVGPGFALGTGTSISPVGTLLGPVPGVPVLGALPTADSAFGFVTLIVPVAIGFIAAVLVRRRLVRDLSGHNILALLALAGVGIGLVAGIGLGVLAAMSAGAAGPERLVDVGPNGWTVGLWSGIVTAIAAVIGMAAGPTHADDTDELPELHSRPNERTPLAGRSGRPSTANRPSR